MADTYTSKLRLRKPGLGDRNWNQALDANSDRLDSLATVGSLAVSATETPSSSRNVQVGSGSFRVGGSAVAYAGTSSTTIAASSTIRLWLTEAGTLTTGASYPAYPHVRLATVTTDATKVTAITDDRLPFTLSGSGLPGSLFSQTSGVAVANTTTETTLAGTGSGTLAIPANSLIEGRTIRVTARGVLSTTGTPTLNLRAKLGSTTVVATGAVATAGTISNHAFELVVDLVCRTTGASGTVIGEGRFWADNAAHTGLHLGLPATATVTVNTTTDLVISLTAAWGTASASNTITAHTLTAEVIR